MKCRCDHYAHEHDVIRGFCFQCSCDRYTPRIEKRPLFLLSLLLGLTLPAYPQQRNVNIESVNNVRVASDGILVKCPACPTGSGSSPILLGDGMSNPTVAAAGAYGLLYNGVTWDRVRGDSNAGLWVNLKGGGYALESGGNLAFISGDTAVINLKTTAIQSNTLPLITSNGGGYVRQDSTATIAKETGGNLAAAKTDLDTIVTNTTGIATAVRQDTGNTSLSTIATNTTGLATATNQTTQITSEQSIDSKIPKTVNGYQPIIIMQTVAQTPPLLTAAQLANPLLYRAAMRQYCSTNLCPTGK